MSDRKSFRTSRTVGVWFAACFAMNATPMGCATTDEYAVVPAQPTDGMSVEQEFPDAMVAALKSCAEAGASRLSFHSYDVSFEVEADSNHEVQEVKLNGG